MQFELKPLSVAAIPAALEKAHRYRLLNEPWQAESICEDVLRIEPRNQTALVTLLLAITDQFGLHIAPAHARQVLSAMDGEYERAYYAGIIAERSARARIRQGLPAGILKPTRNLRKPCAVMNARKRCALLIMMMRCCVGILAHERWRTIMTFGPSLKKSCSPYLTTEL